MNSANPQGNPLTASQLLEQTQDRLFKAAIGDPKRKFKLANLLRDPDILRLGAIRAKHTKGRHAAGTDRVDLAKLSKNDLEQTLRGLAADMSNGTYAPDPAKKVGIAKASGKTRMLTILSARDRIVLQALLILLHPIAEADLSDSSCGCRPGLGPQQAVLDVVSAMRTLKGQQHIVRCDIAQCFDNIPHDRLQALIFRRVIGKAVRDVISNQLSKWSFGKDLGVPQGSPLSPLLANWYLSPIDEFFKRRKTVLYRRYMDDFFIVVPGTLQRARQCLEDLERQLGKLGLKLNHHKTTIADAKTGVEFLGVNIRLKKAGCVDVQIPDACIEKIRYKCEYISKQSINQSDNQKKLHAAMAAWAGYYMQFNPTTTTRVIHELRKHMSSQLGRTHQPKQTGPTTPQMAPNGAIPYPPNPQQGYKEDETWVKEGDSLPAREIRNKTFLPFGAKVNMSGNSLAEESQLAADAMATISPKEMSNEELGMKREYARSHHQYWGAALQEVQQQIGQLKAHRRGIVDFVKTRLSSSAPATLSAIDAYTDKNNTYKALLASEQALRTWATFLNQCLYTAQRTIESIDAEMTRRCLAVGVVPVPGRVHMTYVRPKSRRFQRSTNAVRKSMLLNSGRSPRSRTVIG